MVEVDYDCPQPLSDAREVFLTYGNTVTAQQGREVGDVQVSSVVDCREHLVGS